MNDVVKISDTLKQIKSNRISEVVWATILGIAATQNAHAQSADEGDVVSKKAIKEFQQEELAKGVSAELAMAAGVAELGDAATEVDPNADVVAAVTEEGEVVAGIGGVAVEDAVVAQSAPSSDWASFTSDISGSGVSVASSDEGSSLYSGQSVEAVDVGAEGETAVGGGGEASFIEGLSDTALLAILGVGAVAVGVIALSGDDDPAPAPAPVTATTTGKAVDGYIAGATVYYDADHDGVKDEGEVSTTTDSSGNFTLPAYTPVDGGVIVVAPGGRDVLTGAVINTPITAVPSSTGEVVVSPFTTLMASGLTEEQVKDAMGIPDDVDLTTFDPVAALQDPETAAAAEAVMVKAQQLMTVIQASVADATGSGASDAAIQAAVNSAVSKIVESVSSGSSDMSAIVSDVFEGTENAAVLISSVNSVNTAINTSLGGGNLAEAMQSGNAGSIMTVMNTVAVAQTSFINAVENDNTNALENSWSNAESIATTASEYVPTLTADTFRFYQSSGNSLSGANFKITSADALEAIQDIKGSAAAFKGANVSLDGDVATALASKGDLGILSNVDLTIKLDDGGDLNALSNSLGSLFKNAAMDVNFDDADIAALQGDSLKNLSGMANANLSLDISDADSITALSNSGALDIVSDMNIGDASVLNDLAGLEGVDLGDLNIAVDESALDGVDQTILDQMDDWGIDVNEGY